ISGGTTELLRVARCQAIWEINLLGGSTDLSAGQFIDRVGQALGLPFPAGPHLEQ
ncbi:MAG TPA: O-sialoglycoprotein endopeptidase, partial [Firmicutes bacterium]|nr:O-sialoglycoprotein endopeptidase [Bacillota bacterium]